LRAHFGISPNHGGFARDTDIFERGYVDSVGVIELIQFLGAAFEIEIPEDSLLSDDFSTVQGIARIVQRLRSERDAGRR
jgi:acyl carrier protein